MTVLTPTVVAVMAVQPGDGDNQRTSGRPRTPTRRLTESNLKDATRFILLNGNRHAVGEGASSSPSPHNDATSLRRGARRMGEDKKLCSLGQAEPVEGGRGKRRRSESASNARGRPKRTAAVDGEAKLAICIEKMVQRRASPGAAKVGKASPKPASRSRHGSTQGQTAAARRPATRELKTASRRQTGRGGSRVMSLASGHNVRQIPVVKSGSGKTRLMLTSQGASSANPAGKKAVPGSGRQPVRAEDRDDVSTGSSSGGSEQGFHRKDWGLMEVDAVGRNRPPFARTMLYHGTVPFPLPADLCDETPTKNWVIKRWSKNGGRRKIDQEVHECIKANPHPYLVRILDVSPSEGVLMDYWNEGDLHKHMTTARRKFMPVKEIARYMQQLLRGLAHLHKHKVVHCDVSPQNVFLRRDREREDQLKEEAREEGLDSSAVAQTECFTCALGDFGHSYILSQHEESRSGVAHQGAGFVAPEVKDGRVSTMASDVYSAGKILEELLNLSEGFKEAFEKEPKFMVRKLRGLAQIMCCASSSERPTALRACQKLETLGEAIN